MPEIPQKEGVLGSEIAARNRKSLATFHRTFKSQCSIALSCLRNRERFLGSAMGIAIANRKHRCDFPKQPEMPIKQRKTSQHNNWPRYMDWAQVGPTNTIKLGKNAKRTNDTYFARPQEGENNSFRVGNSHQVVREFSSTLSCP